MEEWYDFSPFDWACFFVRLRFLLGFVWDSFGLRLGVRLGIRLGIHLDFLDVLTLEISFKSSFIIFTYLIRDENGPGMMMLCLKKMNCMPFLMPLDYLRGPNPITHHAIFHALPYKVCHAPLR